MQHVIVGDGVAGHTAAAAIREADPDADIHVLTREDTPFYDRIGLRDYVRGGRDRDALVINDADWYREHGIELRLDTEVVSIDRDAQVVETAAGDDPGYDRLLLAVGGTPRTLDMEAGVDHVHHLWTLRDHGDPLKRDLERADEGVVIGGGLLGFDLIGAFVGADVDATYLVREDTWWHSVLDEQGAGLVHDAMREAGVDLRLDEEADAMEQAGDRVRITTGRATYEADVVGIAVGHERNTALAESAGLETDRGIVCDDHLRTSDPHIYAAGDVAQYQDAVLEQQHMGGSWVTAQEQGKIAGRNMAGQETPLQFVDTYTVAHFGTNVASIGDPRSGDGRTVITAMDADARTYRKVVLDGDRIVGAALVGAMQWVHPLKQLILRKADVSDRLDNLEEPGFNPKELL